MGLAEFFENLGAGAQNWGSDLMDYQLKKKQIDLASMPKPRDPMKDQLMQSQILLNMARLAGGGKGLRGGGGGSGGGGRRSSRGGGSSSSDLGTIDVMGFPINMNQATKGLPIGKAASDRELLMSGLQGVASDISNMPWMSSVLPKEIMGSSLTDILRKKLLTGSADVPDFLFNNQSPQSVPPQQTPLPLPVQGGGEPEYEFDPVTGQYVRVK